MVEELFFRGLLLRSLLGRTPPPVAIVISALLFGLAHFEAVQFAGLAVFGVVLGVAGLAHRAADPRDRGPRRLQRGRRGLGRASPVTAGPTTRPH